MKWIWYEYEVDPSLDLVVVVWFVICTQYPGRTPLKILRLAQRPTPFGVMV